MKKSELLAPAGNLAKAKIALLYGADAVYIGGEQFSLRNRASNFTLEQIAELCEFAHERNKKVYVTVNMIVRQEDPREIEEYLRALDQAGIDAIIAASPGILEMASRLNPGYELHLSTQRTTTNPKTIEFYQDLGVSRVVLARENSIEEIEKIAQATDCELEVFIHGGMCVSYSGRCKLSNYMTGRDANRGGCAQSCRWQYELEGIETAPDFSMGSTDLNALEWIEPLMKLGVDSLKIEGRMKSEYYLAVVISAYRKLIDTIWQQGSASPELIEALRHEISKAEKRRTGPGFFDGLPDRTVQIYREERENPLQLYVAKVLEGKENEALVEVHNRFTIDQPLEVLSPSGENGPVRILSMQDLDGEALELCNRPMQQVRIRTDVPLEPFSMIRKRQEEPAHASQRK